MISEGGTERVSVNSTHRIVSESATREFTLGNETIAPMDAENRFNGQEFACSVNAANTSPIMAMLVDDPTVKRVCAPVITPIGTSISRRTSGTSVTMPHPPDIGALKLGVVGTTNNLKTEKIEDFIEYASKKKLNDSFTNDDSRMGIESRTSSGSFQDQGVFDLEDS